jgi:N-acetylglutamate synthase-like GNAT family acetyltransferase
MTLNKEPSDATSTTWKLRSASQCWNAKNIDSRKYVDDAASLLNDQWPRGGSIADYKNKILGTTRNSTSTNASSGSRLEVLDNKCDEVVSLPCSYLLIDTQEGELLGHGRLTDCFEGAGGNAAAATYIITHPRRKGYGRILMKLLEQEAVKLGYHYMYLWTATAIPFYHKLNYSRTERISLNSACLKTLETQQVGVLEAMLAKRSQETSKETVTLPPDAVIQNDVWLRKRLVENVASMTIPMESRIEEIRVAIHQFSPNMYCWKYYLSNIPWQQQIGPSCGLAALRMLRDHYNKNHSTSVDDNNGMNRKPSLLEEAQSQGYSIDGEIFNVNHMIKLAAYCGLVNTNVQSLGTMSYMDVWNTLKVGGTLILPYDSQPFTKKPCLTEGMNAHYGIIVGMVIGYHRLNHATHVDDHIDNNHNNHNNLLTTPQLIDITVTDTIPEDAAETLLLVQHGLSRKLAIASWKDFVTSNGQLHTIDTTKCCHLPANAKMNLSDSVIVCYG